MVFASGSGTNFQAIIDAVNTGQINARINGLISNRDDNKALERARKHDIEARTIRPADFENHTAYTEALLEILKQWQTDLIVLAGYLLKIPAPVIRAYENRIINIHPSLLPKYGGKGFFGEKVHRAVLESGDTETGCTVHIVTEKYDDGPILAQERVPVHASDTPRKLAARVLEKEHKLLPAVITSLIKKMNTKS